LFCCCFNHFCANYIFFLTALVLVLDIFIGIVVLIFNTVVGIETDIFIHSICIANVDIDDVVVVVNVVVVVDVVVILYDPEYIYVSHRVEYL